MDQNIVTLRRNLVETKLYDLKTLPQEQRIVIFNSINSIKNNIEEIAKYTQTFLDTTNDFIIPQEVCYYDQINFIKNLHEYFITNIRDKNVCVYWWSNIN